MSQPKDNTSIRNSEYILDLGLMSQLKEKTSIRKSDCWKISWSDFQPVTISWSLLEALNGQYADLMPTIHIWWHCFRCCYWFKQYICCMLDQLPVLIIMTIGYSKWVLQFLQNSDLLNKLHLLNTSRPVNWYNNQ